MGNICVQTNEQMNEQMNERMNERANNPPTDRTRERKKIWLLLLFLTHPIIGYIDDY